MAGTLEQRYVLEAEIAAGAAGTVWRARDLTTGMPVAVKLLHPSVAEQADVVEAFREEARVLADVRHPGVVRPHEFLCTADGTYALVMDLVAGRDLRRMLLADGPLAPATAASILAQVAAAIAAVHGAGIVHGDVKPGNILVPEPAGSAGVRLVDFGVAQRVQRPTGATHATPEYVAPEVVAGRPPMPASDVYGIGIVAYEALSGRSPFRGGSVDEVLRRHHGWTVASLPGVPESLWQLINRCLELDPAARPTAAELSVLLGELDADLAGLPPVTLAPESPTLRPRADELPADGDFVSLDSLFGPAPAASSPVPAEEPTAVSGPVPMPAAAPDAPWRADAGPAHRDNRTRTRALLGAAAGVVLLALVGLGGWFVFAGGGADESPTRTAEQTRPSASAPARHQPSASTPPSAPSATPDEGDAGTDGGTDGDGTGGDGTDGDGTGGTDGDGSGGQQGGAGDTGDGQSGSGDGSGDAGGGAPGIGAPMPTMGEFG